MCIGRRIRAPSPRLYPPRSVTMAPTPRRDRIQPSSASISKARRGTFSLVWQPAASSCIPGSTSPTFHAPRTIAALSASASCIERGLLLKGSSMKPVFNILFTSPAMTLQEGRRVRGPSSPPGTKVLYHKNPAGGRTSHQLFQVADLLSAISLMYYLMPGPEFLMGGHRLSRF